MFSEHLFLRIPMGGCFWIVVTVLSLRFTPFSITQIIRFKDRLYFNKVRSIDRNTSVRKTIVIKGFLFLKILKTHLIMKLLKLPSALYYQQSVLMAIYFEVNYLTLWGFNSFFIFPLLSFLYLSLSFLLF